MPLDPANAVAFVQMRLRGGWPNLLTTGAVFAMAVAAMIGGSMRLTTSTSAVVFGWWLPLLLWLQALLLAVFAGSRVTAAVRFDLVSGIIESHRMMPLSAGRAIVGYLFGAPSQALVLAVLTLAAGCIVSVGAGLPVEHWLAANAVLALYCVSAWAFLAYLSFLVKGPFVWAAIPFAAAAITQGRIWTLLPPVALLTSPVLDRSIFAIRPAGKDFLFIHLTAAAFELGAAAVFFAAAKRKYARANAVGIGPVLGLCLLAVFAGATWVGIAFWQDYRPLWFRSGRWESPTAQLVCSLTLLTLLAIVPVSAAARLDDEWRRLRARDPSRAGRRPVALWLVALTAGALVAIAPDAISMRFDEVKATRGQFEMPAAYYQQWLATAALVPPTVAAFGYVLLLARRLNKPAATAGVVWFMIAWLGPIGLEAGLRSAGYVTGGQADQVGFVGSFSPVGAIAALWLTPTTDHAVAAVAFQVTLAVGAWAVGLWVVGRRDPVAQASNL